MRRTFYLIVLLALAFGSNFVANADDALPLDTNMVSEQETASSMAWPMLPGESVHDLARLFYPKNHAMQQQFVAKTLRLNTHTQPDLTAKTSFDEPKLLEIPTLKSLSKNATKVSKKSNQQSLKMSYGLKQAAEQLPQKLLQDYEELVNRNAFLKEQLAKLNEKITLLQTKLADMKLIFDKTLVLPNSQPVPSPPHANEKSKNLNKESQPAETSLLDSLNLDLVKKLLALLALLLLGAFILTFIFKNYRARIFDKWNLITTKVPATMIDSGGHIEKKTIIKQQESPAVAQQLKAANEVETTQSPTLEEAKQLVSVNRATDAIALLKATIASQPKAYIRHWLYLLEVFRKFNMKDDFEQYAERLHQTFNVMTPVWYEQSAEIYVPQSLEEFPHIMTQLYGTWPSEAASVYLHSLMTDNRAGDRTGFGQAVIDEILMLIALLDAQKE